jgi:hypothetical protein
MQMSFQPFRVVTLVSALVLAGRGIGYSQQVPPTSAAGPTFVDALNADAMPAAGASKSAARTAVAEKLKPLAAARNELSAVNQFLSTALPAATECGSFEAAVEEPQPLSDSAKQAWTACHARIAQVVAFPPATVQTIGDVGIKSRIADIQALASSGDTQVQQAIAQADWKQVRTGARALHHMLDAVLGISGVELSRFESAVDYVVSWAADPNAKSAKKQVLPGEKEFLQQSQRALDEGHKAISAAVR